MFTASLAENHPPLTQNTVSRDNLYKGEPQHQSYCEHMVDDNNPIFIDPRHADGTEHGAVLCPQSGWLALYFASLGPWPAAFEPLFPVVPTPGKRIVNMSQEVEWSARIKVGDRLSVVRRVADVFQKAITIDPEAVWIVAEAIITNHRDETVCVIRNTMLTHRTPEEVAAGDGAK